MLIKLKQGLDLRLPGAPGEEIEPAPEPRQVGLVGLDYLDLRPSLAIAVGDPVRTGQTLFRHRTHADLRFTAPGSGRVAAINRGPKRSLESVVIELASDDAQQPVFAEAVLSRNPQELGRLLAAAGLWPAFRTRPYSRVPLPGATPRALFVTAIDTQPLAPDPKTVIGQREEDFLAGLDCLCVLCPGPVYLCTAPDADLPVPAAENLKHIEFAGRHPAGLPGTHIHFLEPGVSAAADAWYVGYQDVISIGSLYRTGTPGLERVVAVAGPATGRPRLLRTRLGVDLRDLLGGEFAPDVRVISGSILSGRRANPHTAFLGRYHNQVCLIGEAPITQAAPELGQGLARRLRSLLGDLLRPGRGLPNADPTTYLNGPSTGMIPVEAFDAVWPFPDPPAPLLRALLTGDAETAAALGCLALDEEDLALCAYVCPSKQNYGAALRDTLHALELSER